MRLLDDLNPQQREAVLAVHGPVLVLAGAGSGKTRVITYRIAHLIEQRVAGESILAVTFTNKAAEQMKERVGRLLARTGRNAGDVWLSTFHSFCARLLRREAPLLGLPRSFTIYDEDDQTSVVRQILKRIGHDERTYPPRGLLERISFAKNHAMQPEELAGRLHGGAGEIAAEVFRAYEQALRNAAAVDFDDLLLLVVRLLRDFPEAQERWRSRFQHIQVDEYQDTNRVQYDLLRHLAGPQPNLCVVGDEDQSIYGWRGADVGNILRFAEDFPGARVIRLEQNYRSTQNILDAAGGVVSHNVKRLGKTLHATRGAGSNLRYFEAPDAAAEATYVAEEIFRLQRDDPAQQIAVLYRTNFQSRAFEEALRRASIRYQVVGGFSFYQRAEIKDALAYVRLALHPADDTALLRVLNTPPRGIGKTTTERLIALAAEQGCSLWDAIPAAIDGGRGERTAAPLRKFRELMEGLQAEREHLPPADFLQRVLDQTGYLEMLESQEGEEAMSRAENLRELVNAVAEGSEQGETWEDFLDRAALVSDADGYDERARVTLLTLHSAKGLEFDHVFLAGLEDGLFPHSRSLEKEDELEEERRLCYVGMTRARDSLTLTRVVYRRMYGRDLLEAANPSRFLSEIPGELIATVAGSLAGAGDTRRYELDPEFSQGHPAARYRRRRGGAGAGSRGGRNPLIGMRVRHSAYGLGTIIGVEGEGDDRKLTISFSDYGTKKILERYAQLERA